MCVPGGRLVLFTSLTPQILGHRFDYDTPIEETVRPLTFTQAFLAHEYCRCKLSTTS